MSAFYGLERARERTEKQEMEVPCDMMPYQPQLQNQLHVQKELCMQPML